MTESNHIRGLLYFLCMLSSNALANRPKGVSVELASFYNPDMDFKCLDGSNIIGFIQINDDYCDCEVSIVKLKSYSRSKNKELTMFSTCQ